MRRFISNIYRYFFPLSNVQMYRRMGVQIGENCKIQFNVTIDYSHYWLVTIGNNVTIAPNVHILAHDASMYSILGYTKLGKVEIGNNVFIGAGSIILPGVKIGDDSIIGAGSVITKSVEPGLIVAGNPMRVLGTYEDFKNKYESEFQLSEKLGEEYTLRGNIDSSKMDEMNSILNEKSVFVK